MNQKQQSRGRGSSPRQAAAVRQEDRPRTQNEQITEDQHAQAQAQHLFREIRVRRGQIEAVLPPDVPYTKFEACLQMAIRREPRLLKCYLPSVIKAAIQSAYDGLLPDGQQAVILYSNNKVPGTGRDGQRAEYRLEARYQSMVYGLRLKLVHAGAVKFIDGIVVHKNDHFDYELGANRRLEHKPTGLEGDPGPAIGAYSVAILPDGERVFDVMRKPEIMAAREVAKTKDVWDGPFGLEMWKKTVIRRLSKAIPTTVPIRDAEALEMYPQFAGAAGAPALPAPARPDRRDFQRLGHDQELPLDLSGFEGGYSTEESRRTTREEGEEEHQQNIDGAPARKGGQVKSPDSSGSEAGGSANAETGAGAGPSTQGEDGAEAESSPALPQTPKAWEEWANILIGGLEKLPDEAAVNAEHARQRRLIDAAPDEIRKRVVEAMQERVTDLVAPAPQGDLLDGGGK